MVEGGGEARFVYPQPLLDTIHPMADFFQNGRVTTFHNLGNRPLDGLEYELHEFRKQRPMGLVLPSLFSELEGPALNHIVEELTHVDYLDEIVIGLDRADEDQYRHALDYFGRLPQRHRVLWNDGPRLRAIDAMLQEQDLAPMEPGKGRNVWYCFGYTLASNRAKAVALHDCDITTYSRDMLARLIYPVANPRFSYRFCKGYYARIADNKLNGRVCRLLVSPLIRSLQKVCGPSEFLEYLDSFRYPLAGEFSLSADVLNDIRIPSDWGLEMGVISEIWRNFSSQRICQVDIADVYDHKHQDLSPEDASKGLSKMSVDITKSLYRKLATQGEVLGKSFFRTLKAAYYRAALDLIESYHNDAVMNGLKYDRHAEEAAVEAFAQNIMTAGKTFMEAPMDKPFMPSWERVRSAIPDILDRLLVAVDEDMREYGAQAIELSPSTVVRQRTCGHLAQIYPDADIEALGKEAMEIMRLKRADLQLVTPASRWDQRDITCITYGDSITKSGEPSLLTLRRFLQSHLGGALSSVHVLPFSPYSSDDGFSVIDYHALRKELGEWGDLQRLAQDYKVMGDVVLNHCSAESEWFQQFLEGKEPGKDYFISADPDGDWSNVVRPRSSPLLTKFKTVDGEKHVWCTFSADQVDLNFANPKVLMECLRIIRYYLDQGVKWFRLDAVGFLWKEEGTSCMHLPQTHEIIRLLRLLIEHASHDTVVITETNVPNHENISYFGNGNEAHLIYNFSLPPLLLNTLISGSSQHLRNWLTTMPPAQFGRAYFNFIASHDGIGLRPTEGLLSEQERDQLMETMRKFGGEISMRNGEDGSEKPYEINISLFNALQGTLSGEADDFHIARFLCAHTMVLAMEGIPAFYIHSFLATANDHELREKTGRARSINRHQWTEQELEDQLADPSSIRSRVLTGMREQILIRQRQPAFHPNATQYTLQLEDHLFGVWRQNSQRDQSIFAVSNISNESQEFNLRQLNLIDSESWYELLGGTEIKDYQGTINLEPYQSVWITNRR